jgi:hypothetical protein
MKKLCMVICFTLTSFGLILSQAGTIKDVKPSGGKLTTRIPTKITWTAEGTRGTFKVTLWRNGMKVGTINDKVSAGNGPRSIPWQVGQYNGRFAPVGTGYQIKVKEVGQPATAMSKTTFEIGRMQTVQLKLPKMESMLNIPLGALKYGSEVLISGENFGASKGDILMYGSFPNSPLAFENVEWVSTSRVRGYVPQAANGRPNQTVTIKVKTAGNILSNGMTTGFIGRETKLVNYADVAVVQCGNDGNCNWCNDVMASDLCYIVKRHDEAAIRGVHRNSWGTVGDDVGDDIYQISLKNGWYFKEFHVLEWTKSSSDEVLTGPNPPLPVAKNDWTFTVHWKVSPNDRVRYQFKIVVEGPVGTHYK